MQKHPYRPANKRGLVIRMTTTPDSVPLPQRDFGPCQHKEGGEVCGGKERQMIHQQPFHHRYETKTKVVGENKKGVGSDAPVY